MAAVGLLLLAPLAATLLWLYHWWTKRRGGGLHLRRYDRVAMLAAVVATVLATLGAYALAPEARGPIWPHVFSALGGFFTLLAVLGFSLWIRRAITLADQRRH